MKRNPFPGKYQHALMSALEICLKSLQMLSELETDAAVVGRGTDFQMVIVIYAE